MFAGEFDFASGFCNVFLTKNAREVTGTVNYTLFLICIRLKILLTSWVLCCTVEATLNRRYSREIEAMRGSNLR